MLAERGRRAIFVIGSLLLLVSFFHIEDFKDFEDFKGLRDLSITGNVVSNNYNSQAGNVTEANLSRSASTWQGFFGEITINASASTASAIAQGGGMTGFDLELPCTGGELYLSILNDLDFKLITKGTVEAVNTYLSLNSSNPQSGTQVFKNLSSFTVNETLITDVPATYTAVKNSPENTSFNLGVLNHSDDLVFVSDISFDTIGFDGNSHDYQIMVPVNESGITYYFFSDCAVAAPVLEEAEKEAKPPKGNPSEPAPKPVEVAPPRPKEEVPIVIEIIEKEGKLLATGYPIAIIAKKGQKTLQEVQVHNIGNAGLTNIFIVVSGLALDTFTISPLKYDFILPDNKRDFTLEFKENLDVGVYKIELIIYSDQAYTKIEGVLIVEGVESAEEVKLPLIGAAAGFAKSYGKILLYLTALLILFFFYILLARRYQRACHPCNIADVLHHHEKGERVVVVGKAAPLRKTEKGELSMLSDKTDKIFLITSKKTKGKVQVQGVVGRDSEQHKYIEAEKIKRIDLQKEKKRKRKIRKSIRRR